MMENSEEGSKFGSNTAVEDLKLLIESIKYQEEDLEFQEQALKTMASLFRTCDNALSYLVRSDGLEHILRILISSNKQPSSLREACLHALCAACENNDLARQALCTQDIFFLLKRFLLMKSSTRLQTLSCYLLICLITNNVKGQDLARETKCIETLRYLFKDICSPSCSPRIPNRLAKYLSTNSQDNEALINLWQTVTNALSVCVNNPQNNENQLFCSSVFPAAVAYLRNCDSSAIKITTLTFLTNCLTNNSRSQVSFRLVGGLRVLCDIFREELFAGRQIPSSVLKSLILTMEAAVCGNDMCRDSIAEMEIVHLLLQSLQLCFAAPKFKIQCLITLAACIERCEQNCKQFYSSEGMSVVVKLLVENQNCEGLQKAATCVLHTYLEETKSTIPKFMDDVLTSELLRDNIMLLQAKDSQKSIQHLVQVQDGVYETHTKKTTRDDSNGDITSETERNVSAEQKIVVNKMEDLTNEIRSLKQLFTTEEEDLQNSVTKNLLKSVMDIVNTACNSSSKSSSDENDGSKNIDSPDICTSTTSSHQTSSTITSIQKSVNDGLNTNSVNVARVGVDKSFAADRNGLIEQSKGEKNSVCDGMASNTNHENTTSSKEGHNIKMMGYGSELTRYRNDRREEPNSSTQNKTDKSSYNTCISTNSPHNEYDDKISTEIVENNSSVTVESNQQLVLKCCAENQSNSATTVNSNDILCEINGPSCVSDRDDCTVQEKDKRMVSKDKNGIPNAKSDCIGDFSSGGNRIAIDSIDRSAIANEIREKPGIKSIGDQCSSNSPNSGEPSSKQDVALSTMVLPSKICSGENDDVIDEAEARNIRYGETPAKQTTMPTNARASKRPPTTAAKQGMKNGRESKRMLLMTDDQERDLPDIIEGSLFESSDKDLALTTKHPLKAPTVSLRKPLMQKQQQKISPKCLGCRCDFSKVNSHNFLSTLRCNINTCCEHRVFIVDLLTTLRRYKAFLETNKRSPDFQFVASPKLNVRCDDSPIKIMRKVKPQEKRIQKINVPFSTKEIEILKQGVEKYGPRFNIIERNCQFSTKRSARTLRQKFASISMRTTTSKRKQRRPFTAQEEDNLKAGVSRYGYQWRTILEHYRFKQGRTPQNLKDKWRNLLKDN